MAAVPQEFDPLHLATTSILAPAGLDIARLERVLDSMHDHALDEAELYFQLAREESWSLEDGIVKDGAYSIDQGVGVRAMAGERTGFAYSDDIVLPALEEAARAARAIARRGGDAAAPGARGCTRRPGATRRATSPRGEGFGEASGRRAAPSR